MNTPTIAVSVPPTGLEPDPCSAEALRHQRLPAGMPPTVSKWTGTFIALQSSGLAVCSPTSYANARAAALSEAYRPGLSGGRDVSVYSVAPDGTREFVETVRGAEPMSFLGDE